MRIIILPVVVWCLAFAYPANGAETIVTFGDSTTAPRAVDVANNGRPFGTTTYGLNQSDASNPPHNTVLQVNETTGQLYVYTDMLRDRIAVEPEFDLKAIDNEGINGNRTDQAVERLSSDVLAKAPQIVVVQFGINDSVHDGGYGTPSRVAIDFNEQTGGDGILGDGNDHPHAGRGNYTDNLTQIVQTLLGSEIDVILMTPNQVLDFTLVTNERLSLYAQAVRDVAGTESVQLIDVWNMYQDVVDAGGSVDELLLDEVHPNGDGQELVADALFDAIVLVGPPNGIVGDVNQDGSVSGNGDGLPATDDVAAFREGWQTTGHVGEYERYTHGDMNFDGITDLKDAYILHNAFKTAGKSVAFNSLFGSAVPEPASCLLCLVYVGVLLVFCLARLSPGAVAGD